MAEDLTRPRRLPGWTLPLLLLPFLLGACAPGAAPGPTPPGSSPSVASDVETWRTAELRDVRSGEILRVDQMTDRVVVIETMAIWCSTCRIQQNEARKALANLDDDRIVYVSLNVDLNETEADLTRYAEESGYPWHFVVASREVARSLAETFGDQVLSPPSTPKIVVSPDGEAELSFGVKTAALLETELAARLP